MVARRVVFLDRPPSCPMTYSALPVSCGVPRVHTEYDVLRSEHRAYLAPGGSGCWSLFWLRFVTAALSVSVFKVNGVL